LPKYPTSSNLAVIIGGIAGAIGIAWLCFICRRLVFRKKVPVKKVKATEMIQLTERETSILNSSSRNLISHPNDDVGQTILRSNFRKPTTESKPPTKYVDRNQLASQYRRKKLDTMSSRKSSIQSINGFKRPVENDFL